MFCEMSGDCELQALAYRYGMDHWIYQTPTRRSLWTERGSISSWITTDASCVAGASGPAVNWLLTIPWG